MTLGSARFIISMAVCGFSQLHYWPVEGLSLPDFPDQNKSIHKSAMKQSQRHGGLEHLFSPTSSEESNTLIHQILQTKATNLVLLLFCFVPHIGTVTRSYYTLSRISLATSLSPSKFTKRAEANNPGIQGDPLFMCLPCSMSAYTKGLCRRTS